MKTKKNLIGWVPECVAAKFSTQQGFYWHLLRQNKTEAKKTAQAVAAGMFGLAEFRIAPVYVGRAEKC